MNLMTVMISALREGVDIADVIHRRTAKLSILFKRLIRQGIAAGRLREIDIDSTSDAIINLAELECFQVAFFRAYSKEASMKIIKNYLESFRA